MKKFDQQALLLLASFLLCNSLMYSAFALATRTKASSAHQKKGSPAEGQILALDCPGNKSAQIPCRPQPACNLSMSFDEFLLAVTIAPTNVKKNALIESYLAEVCEKNNGWPLVEYCKKGKKSLVDFVFRPATPAEITMVLIAGEWNAFGGGSIFGPRPNEQNIIMNRISLGGEFPDLFYFRYSFENNARLNYDFVVDGTFLFDPLNPLATPGAFGGDSTLIMPEYCPQPGFKYNNTIPHGRVLGAGNTPLVPLEGSPISGNPAIDPLNENHVLNPINPFIIPQAMLNPYIGGQALDQGYWVYLPAGYNENESKRYPVIYFLFGQEYLKFGNANNILDYLIAHKCIEPVIAVFHNADTCVTINNAPCGSGFFSAPLYEHPYIPYVQLAPIGTFDADGTTVIQPFADFFIKRLIPEIDAQYRTIPCAKARTLAGITVAANQTLFMVLGNPNVFKKGIIQSLIYPNINQSYPALDDLIQGLVNDGTPPGETPPQAYRHDFRTSDADQLAYLKSFFPEAQGVSLFMDWGTYENPSFTEFFEGPVTLLNNEICNFLKENVRCVTCNNPNEGSSWGQWPRQLELALPQLLQSGKYKSAYQRKSCNQK